MKTNLQINEDWERESVKDLVYLQETETLLQQELDRKPAEIIVINNLKILDRQYEHQHNPLPF